MCSSCGVVVSPQALPEYSVVYSFTKAKPSSRTISATPQPLPNLPTPTLKFISSFYRLSSLDGCVPKRAGEKRLRQRPRAIKCFLLFDTFLSRSALSSQQSETERMRKCKTEKLLDKNLLTLRISLIFAVRYCRSWKRHRAIKLQLCGVKVRLTRKHLQLEGNSDCA